MNGFRPTAPLRTDRDLRDLRDPRDFSKFGPLSLRSLRSYSPLKAIDLNDLAFNVAGMNDEIHFIESSDSFGTHKISIFIPNNASVTLENKGLSKYGTYMVMDTERPLIDYNIHLDDGMLVMALPKPKVN